MEKPPRPRKELRQGFSTGTAAAAAAQGALRELLELPCPETGGSASARRRQPDHPSALPSTPGGPGRGRGDQGRGGRPRRHQRRRDRRPGLAAGRQRAKEEIVFQGGAGRGPGDQTRPGAGRGRARHQPGAPADDPPQPEAGLGAGFPGQAPAAGSGNLRAPGARKWPATP